MLLFGVFGLAGGAARAECLPDGIWLTLTSGPAEGELMLNWSGADPGFELYRSESPSTVVSPENLLATTDERKWTDSAAVGAVLFYRVLSTSSLRQIGFENQGPDGNFDLDIGVPDASRNGSGGACAAYSWVAPGESSSVRVQSELGFIDDAEPGATRLHCPSHAATGFYRE